MAETQAVYYRDKRGVEPVDDFVESLPDKPAAKIDGYVEEYLNGRPADAPPPDFPVTSQIDGAVLDEELLIGHRTAPPRRRTGTRGRARSRTSRRLTGQ